MCDNVKILLCLHDTSSFYNYSLRSGDDMEYDDTRFLLGGDQLTIACICGTQALWDTQDKLTNHFKGVTPVVEDWHSRMKITDVKD